MEKRWRSQGQVGEAGREVVPGFHALRVGPTGHGRLVESWGRSVHFRSRRATPTPLLTRAELLAELADVDHALYGLWRGRSDAELLERPSPGAWCLAEIVAHVAAADRAYLDSMREAVDRRTPAETTDAVLRPGLFGGWFASFLAPPVRHRARAPRRILPPPRVEPAAAWRDLQETHGALREWIRSTEGLDLAAVRFRNPFVPLVRWRVSAGLLIVLAHGRRHLAQARRTAARNVLHETRTTPAGPDP